MKELLKKMAPHHIAMGAGLLYSLIICFHFFRPGYLWGLDYFFPLFGGLGSVGSNGFILGIISTITHSIMSSQIVEKIIIFCAFFVPFIGGVFLVKKSQSIGAMIFAGMTMTCNPFFYDRFVDGQMGIYLLFCVVPFWLISLYTFFSHDQKKIYYYLVPIILSLVTTSISMHGAWFLCVSFIVFFAVFFDINNWRNFLKHSIALGIGVLVVNLYWIIPNVVDTNAVSSRMNNFSSTDLTVFQNYIGKTNNYLTTLSLQGYRGEGYHRFTPSYGEIDGRRRSSLIFFSLFVVILLGIFYTLKDSDLSKKKLAQSMLILTILGYILGLGTAGDTLFAGLTHFLYDHIPFYSAMRESHKRVLLMVVGYAYFGGYGLHALGKFFHRGQYNYRLISFSILILLVGYSPSLFSMSTQIPVVDYPQERYTLRAQLLSTFSGSSSCSLDCYDMLVLPWHQYMKLSFVGKNVLNPASTFFSPIRALQGDNIEIGPLYSQTNNQASHVIADHLSTMEIINNNTNTFGNVISNDSFISYLKSSGVRYIVLLKEVDYQKYEEFMTVLLQKHLVKFYMDNDYLVAYTIY